MVHLKNEIIQNSMFYWFVATQMHYNSQMFKSYRLVQNVYKLVPLLCICHKRSAQDSRLQDMDLSLLEKEKQEKQKDIQSSKGECPKDLEST